ncbi:hypothetical protein LTR86_009884 [Recurvomyces mirabilis]|nr:hypothetical protein LTR86_009884 [Recurvomyces mirabilis]
MGITAYVKKYSDRSPDHAAIEGSHPLRQIFMAKNRRDLVQRQKFSPMQLFHLLRHAQVSDATDPWDCLYAILGVANSESHGFKIDYAASVAEVYQKFALYIMARYHNLDILGYANDLDDMGRMPSWISDQAKCDASYALPKQHWQFLSDYEEVWRTQEQPKWGCSAVYNASGRTNGAGDISPDGRSLTVQGLLIDHVNSTTENDPTATLLVTRLLQDATLKSIPYTTGGARYDALAHTLCADVVHAGSTDAARGATVVLDATGEPGIQADAATSADSTPQAFATSSPRAALGMLTGRSLFDTGRGYVGLGPSTMRRGDQIYVVAGAQVAFVLRPAGHGDEFVGEAYVHGVMDGEAVKGRKGEFSDIKLL